MKSCVCADIMSTLMFIVFVCPAWFTGKVIYNAVTCSMEGFLTTWAELSLHAGLVFLLIQRYILAHKMTGHKIFRDKHRLCVALVWLVTGIISSLPLISSLGIYVHNKSLSHCVLDSRTVRLLFDSLSLFVPAVFLILAAVINGQANQYLQKHGVSSLQRNDITSDHEVFVPVYGQTMQLDCQTLKMAGEVTMGVLASFTLKSSMTGMETTLGFTAVAYSTALWTLSIFGLRVYGTWTASGFSLPLATTHLLRFSSGFTRAVIFVMVNHLARPYLRDRGFLDNSQLSSAYSEQYRNSVWRWAQTDTSTSNSTVRTKEDSQVRPDSRVMQTPVESPMHKICDSDMAAFWSNKPCDEIMSDERINRRAESAFNKSILPIRNFLPEKSPKRDCRNSDDYAEVIIKNFENEEPKKRLCRREDGASRRLNKNFSILSAFGPQSNRQHHGEVEAKISLSTSTRHKNSFTGGEFIWLNRLSDSESEGVVIYDRFLVEKTNHKLSSLLFGLADKDMTDETDIDARRQSEDTNIPIRVVNKVGSVDGQRRRTISRQSKDESEATSKEKRSKSGSDMTTASIDDQYSRREKGKARYPKEPPPGRLCGATYSYTHDKHTT
ncbi:hypothetical protein PoB_002060000 [Plakobranchus ocellatus]|uniref:G-protein coupled receptors family 1 profile domain-containing protein n=1 Tax=Plakobranchus ocellatus TaxID=259542 RepID=A0AAV3ZG20_9GAST|nr:hypothetical protein PoB_002060000 [Plakobranchus ocellatus]